MNDSASPDGRLDLARGLRHERTFRYRVAACVRAGFSRLGGVGLEVGLASVNRRASQW